ncbi:MAG: DUF5330 domain-containing protein [Pseudomonadota bacterium]
MGFLLRTAFWLSLVLLVLPIDRESAGISEGPGLIETVGAAHLVWQDMRGFCDRNPQACATGTATVEVMRQKAVYSTGIIRAWLADENAQISTPGDVVTATQPSAPGVQTQAEDPLGALLQANTQRRVPVSDGEEASSPI